VSLPRPIPPEAQDWSQVDLVFGALADGSETAILAGLPDTVRIVDTAASLCATGAGQRRGREVARAPEPAPNAVCGLTEFFRSEIPAARMVGNPGALATAVELALVPLIEALAIDPGEITIDIKAAAGALSRPGPSGATAGAVEDVGFAGTDHDAAEIELALSRAAGRSVVPSLAIHRVPTGRGVLATLYVKFVRGHMVEDLHHILTGRFLTERFVDVLPFGRAPDFGHVRGANRALIGVLRDRRPGRAILAVALDDLMKGSAGQAVQNANLMMGFDEGLGLTRIGHFP
jgi:N-acetyl-gamma-glutamyl-phosphate reductase